jgi:hypothetical protein
MHLSEFGNPLSANTKPKTNSRERKRAGVSACVMFLNNVNLLKNSVKKSFDVCKEERKVEKRALLKVKSSKVIHSNSECLSQRISCVYVSIVFI